MKFHGRVGRLATLAFLLSMTVACREDAPVKVSSLHFEGVQQVDEAQLRAVLRTKAGSWIPFSKKPAFDTDEFQNDLQRLRAFYTERGYPDARVTGVDVLFDEKKEHVRLDGDRAGRRAGTRRGDSASTASTSCRSGAGRGSRRRSRFAPATSAIASVSTRPAPRRSTCSTRGAIPTPRSPSTNSPEKPTKASSSSSAASPGRPRPSARWRSAATPRSATTSSSASLRSSPAIASAPAASRRARAGWRRSSCSASPTSSRAGRRPQPAAVPMRITVAEDKHRQFTGAAGYGTEEKARVRGEWKHVNFFGGARTAGLESKWSSLDRGVRLNFNEPWFFTRHLAFSAQAQTWDEREPVYRVTTYGGRVGVSWRRERRNPVSRRGATTSVGRDVHRRVHRLQRQPGGARRPVAAQFVHQPRTRSGDRGRDRHARVAPRPGRSRHDLEPARPAPRLSPCRRRSSRRGPFCPAPSPTPR